LEGITLAFPRAQIKRIMKNAGAKKISKDAIDALDKSMEDRAVLLTKLALLLAKHAGRKTVTDADFTLLSKIISALENNFVQEYIQEEEK